MLYPRRRDRRSFPLHLKYTGSQLAFAVSYLRAHPDTRLVSLMIGANDLFRCQETTKDGCQTELPAARAALAHNVRRILSTIRNQAHYRGQLVIFNYYALNYGIAAISGQSTLLNSTVDGAARQFHVRFADGFGELHTATVHSGGDPCKAGLLTQTGAGKCGIHPSYAGQVLLAHTLHNAISL